MIAMRVVGLMIAFACFNACIGQLLDVLSHVVSSVTAQRAETFFYVLDSDLDGIAALREACDISDCISEKLHFDEETKKSFCDNDVSMAWKLFGFDKAESGLGFHVNMMLNILALGKGSPLFKLSVRRAFALLFHALRCYTNNSTITFNQFCAFHSCIQTDSTITRPAFVMIDVDKDGAVSEDELCDAGVNFMTGEDQNGPGALLFGRNYY